MFEWPSALEMTLRSTPALKPTLEYVALDLGHVDTRTTMRYLDQLRRRENHSALRLAVEF